MPQSTAGSISCASCPGAGPPSTAKRTAGQWRFLCCQTAGPSGPRWRKLYWAPPRPAGVTMSLLALTTVLPQTTTAPSSGRQGSGISAAIGEIQISKSWLLKGKAPGARKRSCHSLQFCILWESSTTQGPKCCFIWQSASFFSLPVLNCIGSGCAAAKTNRSLPWVGKK